MNKYTHKYNVHIRICIYVNTNKNRHISTEIGQLHTYHTHTYKHKYTHICIFYKYTKRNTTITHILRHTYKYTNTNRQVHICVHTNTYYWKHPKPLSNKAHNDIYLINTHLCILIKGLLVYKICQNIQTKSTQIMPKDTLKQIWIQVLVKTVFYMYFVLFIWCFANFIRLLFPSFRAFAHNN